MNTNKEYKSSLVVWNDDELPVIETFYADSVDEIRCLQEKWMNDHDYESANMHLHHQIHGQWHSIQITYLDEKGRKVEFSVAVIKMSDEDMEMMEDGDTKALAEMLGEDLFLPFAKWFTQYQNSKHKQ